MAVGTLWVFTKEWTNGKIIRAQTLVFTAMAMFQGFNSLNYRSRTKAVFKIGFFTNRYLFGAIVASVSLQVLTTIPPFFQTALRTVSLSIWDWFTVILISSSVFFADEMKKIVRSKVKK